MDRSHNETLDKSAMQSVEDGGDKKTFLTNLTEDSSAVPAHMVKLHKLNSCVENIENQFVNILVNHENDFMIAYKVSLILRVNSKFVIFIGPYD